MGTIGTLVANLARAFGMHVIHSGRTHDPKNPKSRPLDQLIAEADMVSLHLPLSSDTKGIIDESLMNQMKPGATLINTARGALIDEQALFIHLKSGRLGSYAADVPDAGQTVGREVLAALPNVYLTPHLASLTARTYTKMCVDAVNNVLALLRNQKPLEGCIFNENQLTLS